MYQIKNQEHFVRNGKWVNDDTFVRFFKNGIEKAKKIEELYEELLWPVSLEGTVYYYDDRHNDKTLHSVNIKSTLDLDDFLEDVDKFIAENTDERKLYISISFNYKVKMKYLKNAVFDYKNKVGFEFWLKFFDEYKMSDLDEIFSDDKKDFVSFVDDNRFHSLSGKRFNFRIFKLDLTEEQMKTYLKWAEEYFYEFRTEDYLDLVQSMRR